MPQRRRASTMRREDPSLDALVAQLPGEIPAAPPEKRQEPVRAPNVPFKGWKDDQERWVKDTGRWGR